MVVKTESIHQLTINTIRTLTMDSVEKAQSGHPGMPLGAAPMAYTLWSKAMKHNPQNPEWFNRDRFVLSSGHGSMLLYSLLHLFGYPMPLEELKAFRQWGSKTTGHPEYGDPPGVEATTGPLGQGFAMSVGMAMAERHLAATYNRPGYPIIDHFTYSICGDGDLMEGISSEAASLAGHLKLGRLIVMYDSNGTSLDGELDLAFSEDVQKRFEAYHWQVLYVEDGNDTEEIARALETAKSCADRPTLIEIKTTIGYGAPNKAGKSIAHGSPLGAEEVENTKAFYGWEYDEEFYVPKQVYKHCQDIADGMVQEEKQWHQLLEQYKKAHPEIAEQLQLAIDGDFVEDWEKVVPTYSEDGSSIATRVASSEIVDRLYEKVPQFFGGAADLSSSTKIKIANEDFFRADNYQGKNIAFGVREFAMAAASNGIALHGGLRSINGTYFVFSDYLRSALRLSALMGLPVTYIFTHDSIAVGEDGPTHQPVEHLISLRAMPDVSVIRPADANETVAAWKQTLKNKKQPTVLVLSRQGLPVLPEAAQLADEHLSKGAYIISEAQKRPQALLVASGSEVHLCLKAKEQLYNQGIDVSVISMPSWDLFEKQDETYKEKIFPSDLKVRLAVEMGSTLGWHKYLGTNGDVIGIDHFGRSGNGNKVLEEYGFTVDAVVSKINKTLNVN
ncbi:transketolase [Oceanobacillus oncorhynchi]|uniref:transketolase n=1 Tax=Oceanobacillus oncorhynchi TaxID=545501 RepID=UPI0034D59A42